jgi:cation-transporting ATPase 13A1
MYIILSVLGQSAVHMLSLIYIHRESMIFVEILAEDLPVDAKFRPNILNSSVYLVSLIMQISTFAINYQGKPFREPITNNKAMLNSLVIVGGIAFAAAAEISPELNEWMQLVTFPDEFRTKLLLTMTADFGIAWIIEYISWSLFANNAPKASLYPSA